MINYILTVATPRQIVQGLIAIPFVIGFVWGMFVFAYAVSH